MIPEGTTSRQLAAIARWSLAIVLLAGSLSWWWPSARSWGATAGALLVAFVVWLMWKINRADVAVPASPFHLALAGPAVLWGGHFLLHALVPGYDRAVGSAGAPEISALYQLSLLALAAVLAQNLFASRRGRDLPILLCGTAMVVGALAATLWGKVSPIRQSLNLLAFAGVGLWISVLYSRGQRPFGGDPEGNVRNRARRVGARRDPIRIAAVVLIAVMFAALAALFPPEGLLAAGLLASAGLLGLLCFRSEKTKGIGAFLRVVLPALPASGGIVWIWSVMPSLPGANSPGPTSPSVPAWSLFGAGGNAFGSLTASTSGVAFLGAAVGWAGAGWLGAGILAASVWALWRARGGGEGVATVFRLGAAGLTMAAFLSPSGEFVPSVTLAVGFTWGLLFAGTSHCRASAPGAMPLPVRGERHGPGSHAYPRTTACGHGTHPMTCGKTRARSGWVLLGLVGAIILLLALAPEEGLASWSGRPFGLGQPFLHVTSGFLMAILAAWRMGSRRLWKGLLGIGLAVAASGAGELSQLLTTARHAGLLDFLVTSAGCCAGAVPYLLAVGARMCESPAADLPGE